ncbi:MAG: hypothetical protein QNJ90_05715 [Planctomycetota bacterium]|nr:hypothetical protein [Planctomycetota bacterium]
MRTSTLAFAFVILLAGSAYAADEGAKKSPLEVVEELATYVARDDADFEGGNALYKAAKDAIKAEAEAIEDEEKRVAAKRYADIQTQVASKLRRDTVPVSGWLMGLFGATLLWGGLLFCIGVARKKGGGGEGGDA